MYYVTFNAITDALEIATELPLSRERERLLYVLKNAQQESEEIYLVSTDMILELLPKCS